MYVPAVGSKPSPGLGCTGQNGLARSCSAPALANLHSSRSAQKNAGCRPSHPAPHQHLPIPGPGPRQTMVAAAGSSGSGTGSAGRSSSGPRYALPTGGNSKLTHFGFATDFHDKFTLGEFLGSGTFGSVHVCTQKATGERFAVKTITKKLFGGYLESNFVKRVQHEVDMYNHLGRSLNVAHLYSAYEDDQAVDLVMELCSGGDLWHRIKKGKYSERDAARIVAEVLRAVAQCHARGVVVRDIKPENFLFASDEDHARLKLIDFGIAEYCAPGQFLEDRAGTPIYCAPEVLRRKYSLKADVWSAGVIAYELLAARLPFEDDDGSLLASDLRLTRRKFTNRDVFNAILYADLDFEREPWPAVSDLAKDFVKSLLVRDPDTRPSAAEALRHPWLLSAMQEQGVAVTDNDSSGSPDGGFAAQGASSSESSSSEEEEGAATHRPLSDTLVQRLQRYGTYARLKQVALSKVASFMAYYDTQQLRELKGALMEGLTEQNGRIPYTKVEEVLKSGRWDLSDTEVRQLLSAFTIDADGCIDMNEWLAALIDWREVQQTDEWDNLVEKAFDAIDTDHSGRLGVSEIEALLCNEDEGCPVEDTVPAALRAAEADIVTAPLESLESLASQDGDAGPSPQEPSAAAGPTQEGITAGGAGAANRSGITYAGAAPSGPSGGLAAAGGIVYAGMPSSAAATKAAPASSGGGGGTGRGSFGEGKGPKSQVADTQIDLPAFARLLRTAQQDRLELFESRRRRAAGSTGQGPSAGAPATIAADASSSSKGAPAPVEEEGEESAPATVNVAAGESK